MLFNLLSLAERFSSSKFAQAARREKLLTLLASLKGALERIAQGNSSSGTAEAEFINATSDFLSSYKLLAPGQFEPTERLAAMLEAANAISNHNQHSAEQVRQLLAEVNAVVTALD